jgi:ankyrin repeat protein/predicted Ser/Thr protein kinase
LEKSEPGGETLTSLRTSAWAAPSLEEIAAQFPQLEILEMLGQGGMGIVYRARQKSLDRMVALKILAVPPDAGPDFAERFSREARALASLSHTSIVTVYDFGRADGRFYLLMEYVDGANLHQLMRSGEMSPRQALEIVTQICEALQFAHDAGVVHRDIKPENILVDTRGQVKIADFGLAKILGRAGDEVCLTGARQVMGTAHYMAPEQIEKPLEVDHRADIYSLGVVFYELLTGELPIGRFQPPSRKIHVDVRVDEVVLRTLEKEPHLRYQKASEIKTDVEGISRSLADTPAAAQPPPSPGAPLPPAGGTRPRTSVPQWAWWLAGAVVLLALLGAAFLYAMPRRLAGTFDPGVPSAPDAALARAAAWGHLEGVKVLLDSGMDVNAPGLDGTPALIEAVDGEHTEIVRLLIDRGANVNAVGQGGTTALLTAVAQGNLEISRMLLAAGANVNVVGPGGSAPLLEAIDGGYDEVSRVLVASGANVNVRGPLGLDALHHAVSRGSTELTELLVTSGAALETRNQIGDTPLIVAVQENHPAVVRVLLDAGASLQATGANGRTAVSVAAVEGRTEILNLIQRWQQGQGASGR